MKFFAFTMAILVITLSCIPCTDSDDLCQKGKQKMEISKTGNQQGNDHQEDCSPFCSCSCCAGFSINHHSNIISSIPIIDCQNSSAFLAGDLLAISLPVWQPPQL